MQNSVIQTINRLSFDFDGCIDSNHIVRNICQMYVATGKEVYILTNRSPEIYRNQDLLRWAALLMVPVENILYAWDTEKYLIIQEKSIDVHFDNDVHEIHKINMHCGPQVGILVHYQYTSNDIHDE